MNHSAPGSGGDRDPARDPIGQLITSGSRVLGLRLCLHERIYTAHLPERWRSHSDPACLAVKRRHLPRCAAFCGLQVREAMLQGAGPRMHTCPFGHTELVAPIHHEGLVVGTLYAGAIWRGDGDPPRPGLVIRPDDQWVADRLHLVAALADRLGPLLEEVGSLAHAGRRRQILAYLHRRLGEPVRLGELATAIGLSPSRAGHLVRECFSCTFPSLLTELRLQEASHYIAHSDEGINAIALRFGFSDQSHFTRAFTRRFGCPPGAYRKRGRGV